MAGASYQLSNQEEINSSSDLRQSGNSFQRISGIQGALNVPAFPFGKTDDYRNTNVGPISIDEGAGVSSGDSPAFLIAALVAVGAYFLLKG